ncbi:hypothetical protein DOM21_16095 [Bacteriovorax stolpii]|uniref:hypothetical protein n=1 Tax=Bacteriovorax stolpii TaxID=960 RepID=UPI001159CBA6|nr:hypothetical protein [Bacteriovorax stolpii]QDK42945.1 hypothetical protein DOM21_16095 [Bacteriovorax stolpii]
MDFNLLYTKNKEQGIVRSFKHNETPSSKIIDINEAKNLPLQGFIFSEELKNDEFLVGLENELKFYPIRSSAEFSLSAERFDKLSYDEAKPIFDKMRENWILQNNISLIEELFKVRTHLLGLFPNDRSGFFEELWFILKSNLGATNLKLIYNDMIKAKNENEKNKLVKVKIVGERFPEMTSIDDMDEMVLKSYEKDFGNIFEITDYNKDKGQLVICASIKKSPVLIMTNIYQLTRLQKAILTSLFEGLNS